MRRLALLTLAALAALLPALARADDDPPPLTVPAMIELASSLYGTDAEGMKRVAMCESTMGVHPFGASGRGVYQFTAGTWAWASAGAGFAGANPLDPWANVMTAHWLWTLPPAQGGGPGNWPTCRWRY